MTIRQLTISDLRNLTSVSIKPSSEINIFYGLNGSGKTSILEAIHILGLARSFRTPKVKSVVQTGKDKYTIFGLMKDLHRQIPVGVSRSIHEDSIQIRISGNAIRSSAELAALLPLQIINPDTFKLLEGSPGLRRNFLDWGVFHVKHKDFLPVWKHMQMALKQRNSLIRHGRISGSELSIWTQAFSKYACQVDQLRQAYVEQLLPYFSKVLQELCKLDGIKINYYRGWDKDRDLDEVLEAGLSRDIQSGYTFYGPQRADLRVRIGNSNATEILSRGQLKLVVCALKLAQGYLLSEATDQKSIFLVDDLSSELDIPHRMALCHLLQKIESQVFITCVEKNALADCWLPETHYKMFHVKQGQVELVENPGRAGRQAKSLEIEHD
ncbi:DNA replication/repair protein RecF [Endozoicomonas sp. Mp262]|uniref:DNA replication/repair protein RecF n=1 Tax=Endozoicomonas sp. Mp262 TaxID=2919499 RepID=UPI0021D994E6